MALQAESIVTYNSNGRPRANLDMHFLLLVIVLEVEHNDTVEEVRRHGDDEPDAGSLR